MFEMVKEIHKRVIVEVHPIEEIGNYKTLSFFTKKGFVCASCGAVATNLITTRMGHNHRILQTHLYDERGVMFTKDHIIPRSRGGSSKKLTNLQTMCSICNNSKGSNFSNDDLKSGCVSDCRPLILDDIVVVKRFKNIMNGYVKRGEKYQKSESVSLITFINPNKKFRLRKSTKE